MARRDNARLVLNLTRPQYELLRIMILVQPERPGITHGLGTGIDTAIVVFDFHVVPVDMEPLNGWVCFVGSWRIGLKSFWVPIVDP